MAYIGRPGATAPLTTADIPDGSITAAKIVDATIVAGDLAPNSVDSSELVDGSVDLSHMSANSVDSDQYVDGSIDNAHLADNAVGTAEIADDAVTGAKLANDIAISTTGAITTTGAFTSVGIDDNASGATAITIDANENVGIGVTPDMLRTTDTALALGATARQFVTSSNHYVDMNNVKLDASGNPLHITTNPATRHQQLNTGVHTFDVAPSASAGAAVSFSTAMTIANDGNVGIGETAPSGKLHVVNGSGITLPTLESSARNMGIFEGDNGENYIVTACPNNSTVGLTFADPDHKAAGAVIYAHGDNHMRFVTNTSERMRIDSSGNVGIGTTSPIASLDIYNVTSGSATTDYDIALRDDGGTNNFHKIGFGYATSTSMPAYIGYDCTDAAAYSTGDLIFGTRSGTGNTVPSERMRIDTSGNILVGKTSAGASTGAQIEPSGTIYCIRSSGPAGIFARNSSTGEVVRIVDDGTDIGSIDTNGSNASYNTSSDYRLKENIVALSGSIDRLKLLKPSKFNFIRNPDKTVDGFIAHEAQEVVPEAVTKEKDAMKTEEYTVSEAKGEVFTPAVEEVTESNIVTTEAVAEVILETDVEQPEELTEGQQWRETTAKVTAEREVPDMQGIDQGKLVPLLVGALQEAITRIETLENA